MIKDFYLPDHARDAYLEKDWGDVLTPPNFEFAPFAPAYLVTDYHQRLAEFVGGTAQTLLEVGSSLGRGYYELCRQIPAIKTATLIEPSENLIAGFRSIFEGALPTVPAPVPYQLLNLPFHQAGAFGPYDLVVCSNVLDQCLEPLALVDFLKRRVRPGGRVVLSCTYQWQSKYIGNASPRIKNIKNLFDWEFLGETNLPFQLRSNERFWLHFLSHVVMFRAPYLTP